MGSHEATKAASKHTASYLLCVSRALVGWIRQDILKSAHKALGVNIARALALSMSKGTQHLEKDIQTAIGVLDATQGTKHQRKWLPMSMNSWLWFDKECTNLQ